ncbi:hypothetical protein NPIL_451141 [Nephila pilipes]|uniref:Uncharacterized protein n=1 Tax=Nephila pilipes TaxID=299642 RepID=A0A8X6NF02_NEPPI|nr:hypothetical protein NPIL_451141 [Nephila pilipes]
MDCSGDINVFEMEVALAIWIQDCNDKRIHLEELIIKRKALSIHENLKEIENSSVQLQKPFSVIKGFYHPNVKKKIKPSTINGSWKPVELPQTVQKENSDPSGKALTDQILDIAHKIDGEGFSNLNSQYLHILFQEPILTKVDRLEIINEPCENAIANEEAQNYTGDSSSNISNTDVNISVKFGLSNEIKLRFRKIDTSLSCKRTFQQNLKICLGQHLKCLKNKSLKRVILQH